MLIGAAALLVARSGWAQATAGSMAGVVRDTSGAALPGATVEVASPALIEKVRSTVTDEQGRYNVVDLRPGIYTVTSRRRDGEVRGSAVGANACDIQRAGRLRAGAVGQRFGAHGTTRLNVNVTSAGQ